MTRIKLETVGQGLGKSLKSLDSGVANHASTSGTVLKVASGNVLSGVTSGMKGAVTAGGVVGGAVGTVFETGLTGVFSLGKGFRDFILRGTVVELAVAVVLGTAFTNLISAVTSDWITPLLGAIFRGSNFWELSFEINGSTFKYGHFINEFLVFILVCIILYAGVVLPLNKLQFAAFKHKAIMRDCPRCLEEISMAATRCKWCCADIELDDEMKQVMRMAEAAMEAEDAKQSRCMRMLRCCFKQQRAVLHETAEGEVELQQVTDEDLEVGAGSVSRRGSQRIELQRTTSSSSGSNVSGAGEAYESANASFSTAAGDSTAINIQQLEAESSLKRS